MRRGQDVRSTRPDARYDPFASGCRRIVFNVVGATGMAKAGWKCVAWLICRDLPVSWLRYQLGNTRYANVPAPDGLLADEVYE